MSPLHLFPVPSTMAARMRKALYPSGSKDDPRDADLLLDLLLQHRDKLHRLSPDTEATRRVQNLVEERRQLVDEKTAQTNRLTGHSDHVDICTPGTIRNALVEKELVERLRAVCSAKRRVLSSTRAQSEVGQIYIGERKEI